MSKLILSDHYGRVSPVLDVASSLTLVHILDGKEHCREQIQVHSRTILMRTAEISQLRADVLICGAVSRPLEQSLISSGLRVISFICGDVDEVITAYLENRLQHSNFAMPGCCNKRFLPTSGTNCGQHQGKEKNNHARRVGARWRHRGQSCNHDY